MHDVLGQHLHYLSIDVMAVRLMMVPSQLMRKKRGVRSRTQAMLTRIMRLSVETGVLTGTPRDPISTRILELKFVC